MAFDHSGYPDGIVKVRKYPRHVVVLGGLVYSKVINQMKILYEDICSSYKMAVKRKKNITYKEVLSTKVDHRLTVRDEVRRLIQLSQVPNLKRRIDDVETLEELVSSFHFNQYASCLSEETKSFLVSDIERCTGECVQQLSELARKSNVLILPRKEDLTTCIDFYQNQDQYQILPTDKRLFSFRSLVKEINPDLQIVDRVGVLETNKEVLLMLPENCLNDESFPLISGGKNQKIVLLTTVQADLVSNKKQLSGRERKRRELMERVIHKVQPGQIIQPNSKGNNEDFFFENKIQVSCLTNSTYELDF